MREYHGTNDNAGSLTPRPSGDQAGNDRNDKSTYQGVAIVCLNNDPTIGRMRRIERGEVFETGGDEDNKNELSS